MGATELSFRDAPQEGGPMGPAGGALLPWWERHGRLTVGLWIIVPSLLAPVGPIYLYFTGGLLQSMSLWTTMGTALALVLVGCLALAGRFMLPAAYYLLELGVSVASLSGVMRTSVAAFGGLGRLLGSTAFAAAVLSWLLVRKFARGEMVKRYATIVLLITVGINVPLLAMRLGGSFGDLLAPRPVAQVAEVGQRLHALRLSDLSGSSVVLTEPGTLYVLNYWATWCIPCREELPLLLEMFNALPTTAPVRLMAVNTEGLDRVAIDAFLEREGLTGLDVYTDPTSTKDLLGTGTIPLTVLIRDGKLLERHVGYGPDTVPSLKSEILRYLGDVGPEASPPPPS